MLSIFSWCVLILLLVSLSEYSKCDKNLFDEEETLNSHSLVDTLPRYVLYDVNEPEGFNLRRDVFIRMASFIHHMNKISDYHWILVLPPWHRLYHWRSTNLSQDRLPWSLFFNVDSIKNTTPVVELNDFFQMNGLRPLDVQVTLQNFFVKSGDVEIDFSDRWKVANCKGRVQKEFWGLNNLTFTKSMCISFQGVYSQLVDIVEELHPRTIIFDHAELSLHEYYAGQQYWKVRKSMQFSKSLHDIARTFKNKYLKSSYVSIHLRRKDFLYGHPKDVPSIEGAAKQIIEKLKLLKEIKIVFVATDGSKKEFKELVSYLQSYQVVKFEADEKTLNTYMDGGVAIIDQIICSQADYFVGTSQSTFSFRIQEEREILGFAPETTFNSFCGDDGESECTQPTKWRLVE